MESQSATNGIKNSFIKSRVRAWLQILGHRLTSKPRKYGKCVEDMSEKVLRKQKAVQYLQDCRIQNL